VFSVTVPVQLESRDYPLWFVYQLARVPCEDDPPVVERLDIAADADGKRLIVAGIEMRAFPFAARAEIELLLLRHFALERTRAVVRALPLRACQR
jgi:hypothetical protein